MTEEKNEIREVAKYSNDFNTVPLKDFSLVQKKILMTLIWLIKETDGSVDSYYLKFNTRIHKNYYSIAIFSSIILDTMHQL